MPILDIIGIALTFIPIINKLGERLLERNMEITILALKAASQGQMHREPAIEVKSSIKSGQPYITIGAVCKLVLINHRTDRSERIVGCTLDLKKGYWLLWNKIILSVPVYGNGNIDKPLNNLELKPLSAPIDIEVKVYQTLPIQKIPHRVKLVLKFRMVGPMRRKEKLLGIFWV